MKARWPDPAESDQPVDEHRLGQILRELVEEEIPGITCQVSDEGVICTLDERRMQRVVDRLVEKVLEEREKLAPGSSEG